MFFFSGEPWPPGLQVGRIGRGLHRTGTGTGPGFQSRLVSYPPAVSPVRRALSIFPKALSKDPSSLNSFGFAVFPEGVGEILPPLYIFFRTPASSTADLGPEQCPAKGINFGIGTFVAHFFFIP